MCRTDIDSSTPTLTSLLYASETQHDIDRTRVLPLGILHLHGAVVRTLRRGCWQVQTPDDAVTHQFEMAGGDVDFDTWLKALRREQHVPDGEEPPTSLAGPRLSPEDVDVARLREQLYSSNEAVESASYRHEPADTLGAKRASLARAGAGPRSAAAKRAVADDSDDADELGAYTDWYDDDSSTMAPSSTSSRSSAAGDSKRRSSRHRSRSGRRSSKAGTSSLASSASAAAVAALYADVDAAAAAEEEERDDAQQSLHRAKSSDLGRTRRSGHRALHRSSEQAVSSSASSSRAKAPGSRDQLSKSTPQFSTDNNSNENGDGSGGNTAAPALPEESSSGGEETDDSTGDASSDDDVGDKKPEESGSDSDGMN